MAVQAQVQAQVDEQLPPIVEFTPDESWAKYQEMVQELLGISAGEFLTRWYGGEYDEVADDPGHRDVLYLGMLASVVAPR